MDYLRNVALVTDAAAAVEVGAFDAQHLAPVAGGTTDWGKLAGSSSGWRARSRCASSN